MPLTWKRGENPYRINYFSMLQIGPNARRGVVLAARKRVADQLERGVAVTVAGRTMTRAEVYQAESRLLDERTWAAEVLLVHAAPATDSRRLCRALIEATAPGRGPRRLTLRNPAALARFLPAPGIEDVGWPEWEELGVSAAGSATDRRLEVQFDL